MSHVELSRKVIDERVDPERYRTLYFRDVFYRVQSKNYHAYTTLQIFTNTFIETRKSP